METVQSPESCLQEHLCFLKNLTEKSDVVRVASNQSGTVKVIKRILEFAWDRKTSPQFLRCASLVEDIIEIYVSHGREAKRQLICSLVEIFVDAVICPKTSVSCKNEVVRLLNLLLEGCSLKIAQELLKRETLKTKIESLFSYIWLSGDFEMQVMLIESLLRLLPQKTYRQDFLHDIIPDSIMYSSFLSIRDSHFDVDCRKFLNEFNMKEDSFSKRIFSFPVENVKLDGEQLYKPDDDGYDSFWIDFNTGSKRITIFCQSTLLTSQLSQNKESRWETLSLRAEDVKRYNCDARDKFWVITVELKVSAQMLTNKQPEKDPHLFICHLLKFYDVQTALSATLVEEKRKASVPQNLFLFQNKDSSSIFLEDSVKIPHSQLQNLKPVLKSQPNLPKSLQDNASQKSSIPLEPMNIITSSISSTDGNRYTSRQSLHHFAFKNKSRTHCKNSKSKAELDLCNESISSCASKNLSTIPAVLTEHSCNILLSTDAGHNQIGGNDNNSASFNKKNCNKTLKSGIVKENYIAEQKTTMFNTDISYSPVTASGDYISPESTLGKKISIEEKLVSKKPPSKSKDQIKNGKKDICVSSSLKKENDKHLSKSRLQAKDVINPLNCQENTGYETASKTRKSSLRSGSKKLLTPLVSFKPIVSKTKCGSKFVHNSIDNIDPDLADREGSARKENLIQKAKEINNDKTSKKGQCLSVPQEKKPSFNTSQKMKENDNEFDDFKSPEAFKKVKKHGNDKKTKKEKHKTDSKGEKNLDKKNIEILNDPTSDHSSDVLHTKSKDNSIHFPRVEKNLEVEPVNKLDIESLLSKNNSKMNCAKESSSSDHKSMTSAVRSSDSGELYVEIDKAGAKTVTGQIQDYVCETQIDEVMHLRGDGTNNNENGIVDGSEDTYVQTSSSNTLKVSDGDIQASSAVIGSYVFNTKKHCETENVICVEKYEKNTDFPPKQKRKKDIDMNTKSIQKGKNDIINDNKERIKCVSQTERKKDNDMNTKSIQREKNDIINDNKKRIKCVSQTDINSYISITVPSSHDFLMESHGILDNFSNDQEPAHKKNLRPCNKDICYTECDSMLKVTQKDKAKKAVKRKNKTKVNQDTCLTDHLFPSIIRENDKTDTLLSKGTILINQAHDSAKQDKLVKMKRNSQNYRRILKSQKIKTTVTTIPVSVGSDSGPSDPYNFDSECLVRLNDTKGFVPYRSNSFPNDDYLDAAFKHSQRDHHQRSKKFTESVHHFQHKYSKLVNVTKTDDLEVSKKIWKTNKTKSKECFPEEVGEENASSLEKTPEDLFKKIDMSDEYTFLTPASKSKKINKTPAHEKNDPPESTKGGLVFPHLDDSIPCTPYMDTGNSIGHCHAYSLETKSYGTELSWIAKVSTAPAKKKKMRGKTYGQQKQKSASPKHQNVSSFNKLRDSPGIERQSEDTSELGLDFNCLNDKKRSVTKKARKTNSRKGYSSFDDLSPCNHLVVSPSGNSDILKKGAKGKERTQIFSSDSIARNKRSKSSQIREQKTTKRKLSFEGKGKERKCGNFCQYSKNEIMPPFKYPLIPKTSLDQMSPVTFNKIKDPIETIPESKGLIMERQSLSFKEIKSGPSSSCRLNSTALKRKYPSVSSDSVKEISYSDSASDTASYRIPKLIPKKLFDSETTLSVSKKRTKTERRPCLNESEQASEESLSNHDEKNPYKSSIYDFSLASSNKEIYKNIDFISSKSKKIHKFEKNLPTGKSLKRKNILKASTCPNFDLNDCSLRISSPPETARDCATVVNSFPSPSLAFHLPVANVSVKSPLMPSSVESPQTPTHSLNYKKKPESCASNQSFRNQASMCNSTIDVEGDEDYEVPLKNLHDLIHMEKMNSTGQSQASSSLTDPQDILRSTNYILKASWVEGKGKRSKAVKEFDRCFRSAWFKAEKSTKEVKETEMKIMLSWSQQVQKLKAHRELSKQSLESLKYACDDMINELNETRTSQDEVKKSVKSALKKDFDTLTVNIKTRFNEHSLDSMKRCLQASFMLT